MGRSLARGLKEKLGAVSMALLLLLAVYVTMNDIGDSADEWPRKRRSVSEVFSTPRRLERSVPCANLTTIFFGRCRLTLLSLMRPGSRAPKRPDTEFSVEREIVLQLPTITRLTAALAAAFVLAGSASAFTISDIRVEGLTLRSPVRSFRIFLSAPVMNTRPKKGVRAIRSLYQSGLFRDVSLTQDGDVVVVHVMERPAVATIETHGIKAFDKEAVEKSLRDVGLAERPHFRQCDAHPRRSGTAPSVPRPRLLRSFCQNDGDAA